MSLATKASSFQSNGSIPKMAGWNFYNTWSYYRLYYKKHRLLAIHNNGEFAKIKVAGKFRHPKEVCTITPNYLLVSNMHKCKGLVFHQRINTSFTFMFPKHCLSYSFIETLEGPLMVMVLDNMIKICHAETNKEIVSANKREAYINCCGTEGIYKLVENKIVCLSYSSLSSNYELPPSIFEVFSIKPIWPGFDAIFFNKEETVGIMYNTREKRALFAFSGAFTAFDSYIVMGNRIIDLTTGELVTNSFDELIYITKKDDGGGYLVWDL